MARSFLRLPLFQAFEYFESSEVQDDESDNQPATISPHFCHNVEHNARRYICGVPLNIYTGTTYFSLDYPTLDYVRKHPPRSNPLPSTRTYYAAKQKYYDHGRSPSRSSVPDSQEETFVEVDAEDPWDQQQSHDGGAERQEWLRGEQRYEASRSSSGGSERGQETPEQIQIQRHQADPSAVVLNDRLRPPTEPDVAKVHAASAADTNEYSPSRGDPHSEPYNNDRVGIRQPHKVIEDTDPSGDWVVDQSSETPTYVAQPGSESDLRFRVQQPRRYAHDRWRARNEAISMENEDDASPEHLNVHHAHSEESTSNDRTEGRYSQDVSLIARSLTSDNREENELRAEVRPAVVKSARDPSPDPQKKRPRKTKDHSAREPPDHEVSDTSRSKGKSSRAARHQRFDPAQILQHAQLAVPDSPKEPSNLLFTCLECRRHDCKRLVRSHLGPKTICDKCAYQYRQRKQVEELVDARIGRTGPSAAEGPTPGTPWRPGRVPGSSQSTRSTPRSRAAAEHEAKIIEALKAHLATPGATVMQEVFRGSPTDMMQRHKIHLHNLLRDDAPHRIEEILRIRTRRRATSPELRVPSTLGTRHQRVKGSDSQRHSQSSLVFPKEKKKRHLTFDTPVLGQTWKKPRLAGAGIDQSVEALTKEQLKSVGEARQDHGPLIAEEDVRPSQKGRAAAASDIPEPDSAVEAHHGAPSKSQRVSQSRATPGSQVVSALIPKSSRPPSHTRTPRSPRPALIEQSTNRLLSPTASSVRHERATRKSYVHWAGFPSPAKDDDNREEEDDGDTDEDDDPMIGVVEINGPSQYPSTQTMLNQAYEDFEGILDSPDKSPHKPTLTQRNNSKGTPFRASSRRPEETDGTPESGINETPNNAAPINTQALFDAYAITPNSIASPSTTPSPVGSTTKTNKKSHSRPSWLKNNISIKFGTSPLAQTPTGSTTASKTSNGLLKSVLKRKRNEVSHSHTEYMTRDSTGSYVSHRSDNDSRAKNSRTSLSSVTNARLDGISPAKSATSGWISPGRDGAGHGDGGMDMDSFLDQTSGMLGSWDVSQEARRL